MKDAKFPRHSLQVNKGKLAVDPRLLNNDLFPENKQRTVETKSRRHPIQLDITVVAILRWKQKQKIRGTTEIE